MTTSRSKSQAVVEVTSLVAGLGKQYPSGKQTLTFGGTGRTVSALTQLLLSYVTLRQATVAAQAAAKTAIQEERSQAPSLLVIVDEFEAFVKATFGNQPTVLAEFGLAPRRVPIVQTAEQKAVAAAKRAATRKARGTMGSRQKQSVKGAINASLVVTPATAASSTAPAASAPAVVTGPKS